MAQKIAVLSQKGGTGKTTAVRTLTDVFRAAGLDVLAVDLDPQGNLSDYFDVPADADPTIADVLAGKARNEVQGHAGRKRNRFVLLPHEVRQFVKILARRNNDFAVLGSRCSSLSFSRFPSS